MRSLRIFTFALIIFGLGTLKKKIKIKPLKTNHDVLYIIYNIYKYIFIYSCVVDKFHSVLNKTPRECIIHDSTAQSHFFDYTLFFMQLIRAIYIHQN